nr:hypothetical protein Iba_chr07cCG8190 [Ipomoea batatas]
MGSGGSCPHWPQGSSVYGFEEVPHIVEACFCTRTVGHPHHPSVRTITWFTVPVI